MTEILVGKVDDCFLITGRGCVVVFDYNRSADFRMGDKIKFVTLENAVVFTKVLGIELIKYLPDLIPDYSKQGILIENTERNRQKFPKNTEIYLLSEKFVK